MTRKRLMLLTAGFMTMFACEKVLNPSYEGDGHIEFSSERFFLTKAHRYQIDFESFDLSRAHTAVYRLKKLPVLVTEHGSALPVCLTLIVKTKEPIRTENSPQGIDVEELDCVIKIRITDGDGDVLSVEGALSQFTHYPEEQEAGLFAYGFYKRDQVYFTPDANKEYQLHLDYTPGHRYERIQDRVRAKGSICLASGIGPK